jgi:hypothetical protein
MGDVRVHTAAADDERKVIDVLAFAADRDVERGAA